MASGAAARFAPYHKWDRNFFLTYVVLIWFGILNGFVPEILEHVAKNKPPYPFIIHVHALAFVGWLVVLTVQTLLIRRSRHDLHKKLGLAAMALAAIMIVVGPATAFYMQRYHWGTPESDPAFIAIQLGDIIGFTGLAGAAWDHWLTGAAIVLVSAGLSAGSKPIQTPSTPSGPRPTMP